MLINTQTEARPLTFLQPKLLGAVVLILTGTCILVLQSNLAWGQNNNDGKVIATYQSDQNSYSYTEEQFKEIEAALIRDGFSQADIDESYEQIITTELLVPDILQDEFQRSGIMDSRLFKNQLEQAKQELLRQIYVSQLAEPEITEERIRAEYQAFIARPEVKTDINVSHILVESSAEAEEIIKQLDQGADFAELAKLNSIDPGSSIKGGSLGYINPRNLVPEFVLAAYALDDGEYSKEPLRSRYGYHIILRVESQEKTQLPQLDENLQRNLANAIARQLFESKINELLQQAKYEILPRN